MPDFVLCEHPDLPGQTARMVNPRNGWTPVAADEPSTPSGGESQDDPTAGQSDPLKENENNG